MTLSGVLLLRMNCVLHRFYVMLPGVLLDPWWCRICSYCAGTPRVLCIEHVVRHLHLLRPHTFLLGLYVLAAIWLLPTWYLSPLW